MGGAIIILTGEMGEPTYRLSCRLIPVWASARLVQR